MNVNSILKSNVRPEMRVRRAASNTDRNFTGENEGNAIPTAVCVNVDWLSFSAYSLYPEPTAGQDAVMIGDWVIEYQKRGIPMYKYSHKIYFGGEYVANMHTHSNNPAITAEGVIKIEIANHVLYSTTLPEIMEELKFVVGITAIKCYSRIDISIDNCAHVHAFLNEYIHQKGHRQGPQDNFIMTNGSHWNKANRVQMKGKARFDADYFDRKTGLFNYFKIGSKRKSLVMYNKSLEIDQKSGKEYIRECWKKAGLQDVTTVWRCELRLMSGTIKEIKDFDIKRISDPNYLLQIFRTQIKNFFEFIFVKKDSNVTRAKAIDLFQFQKLRVPLLEKIPRAIVRGAYKAKMAIHNAFANVCTGVVKEKEKMETAIQSIADNITLYNLHRWYDNHKLKWLEMYVPLPATAGIG